MVPQSAQIQIHEERIKRNQSDIKEINTELKSISKSLEQVKKMLSIVMLLWVLGSSATNAINNLKSISPLLESLAHALPNRPY